MLLSFSRDVFKELILRGEKIHTFRADPKNRWKVGMNIQHWRGNPRNVTANPHQFMEGQCKWIAPALIERTELKDSWTGFKVTLHHNDWVREYVNDAAAMVAKNDGLTVEQFKNWFLSKENAVAGRCIGWTECPYTMSQNAIDHFALLNTMSHLMSEVYIMKIEN